MSADLRPRRSVLYLPASNERALEKAKGLPVDALILDLEDAVAPDAKPAARDAACAAARSGEYGDRELTIRVNAAGTEWHDDDLTAVSAAGPDAIVVPKVDSAEAVRSLVAAMEAAGAPGHTMLWAMVETPRAMLHAEEIAAASDRLAVLVMGTNDLAKELLAEHVPGRAPLLTGLSLALLAARATGTGIVDGVFNDVKDTDGFLAECRQGREMGFDGKTLIHPGQVEGANAAFAPSDEAVADARGVLEAWEAGRGSGVVTYNGRMVERLHVDTAERTLALHEAIAARSPPSLTRLPRTRLWHHRGRDFGGDETAQTPVPADRRVVARLLMASSLMLFLELALIRWLGANVVHLSYFSNFVLLGSFLGIGAGFLISRKAWSVWPISLPLLTALVVGVLTFPVTIERRGSDVIYFTSLEVSGPPAWLALPIVFLVVAVVLAGPAEVVGRCFGRLTPLTAYRYDLIGSLIGIVSFTLLSFLRAPSVVWGVVACALYVVLSRNASVAWSPEPARRW